MEIWKDIDGYEGIYQVSNEGRIKSLEKTWISGKHKTIRHQQEKILKNSKDSYGYFVVGLSKGGKSKTLKVHRLVAEAFIPNPNGYKTINHKDENPENNSVSNLEWCTQAYNNTYGGRTRKTSKTVYQYTLDGKLIKVWRSTAECGRSGFNQTNISKCCCNKYNREGNNVYKGYKWNYANTITSNSSTGHILCC